MVLVLPAAGFRPTDNRPGAAGLPASSWPRAVAWTDGGIIRHDAVVWGYARACDGMGIEIHPFTEVTGINVSNHKVTTTVRVDALKLFEVSTFSAQLSHGKQPIPLLPPFVLDDPELRRDLICRGHERVKTFSWERSVRRTRQVYGEILEEA